MNNRIQKIKESIPKKFFFDPSFEGSSRNKILEEIKLCYKKTEQNNMMNCSPLLTRDQEYHIFRKFNYLKYRLLKLTVGFEKSKDKLGPKPSKPVNLEKLKEKSLSEIESLISKIEETRNILLKSNMRLTFSRVNKFHPTDSFEREEFFSNGYCHILKAIDSFDFRRGYKFSTYCVKVLQSNLMRDYTVQRKSDEKLCIGEESFIEDKKEKSYTEINASYNKLFIKKLLEKLKEDKRISRPDLKIRILLDYYGIENNGIGKKLKDIGEELNISRERVRQIKFDTLKYLSKKAPVYDPLC